MPKYEDIETIFPTVRINGEIVTVSISEQLATLSRLLPLQDKDITTTFDYSDYFNDELND